MASEREVVARAIYEAMYAEIGGDWNAVETKDVWRAKADAVLSALSDRSRSEVGGDVRAQCLSVFKAARDGGMQVPTVAGAWIPVCTAALDSLLAAWSPILAADAERRVRESIADRLYDGALKYRTSFGDRMSTENRIADVLMDASAKIRSGDDAA